MPELRLRRGKTKRVNYAKWGYFFILPFFIIYAVFSFYPLLYTLYISFFENYRTGLKTIGPNFIGIENYAKIFQDGKFGNYFYNTMVMWVIGFIPQLFFALLFASWFTDIRLKLKATGFFKIVNYLPNILMASSVAVLFFALFADKGPINSLIATLTNNQDYFQFTTTFIIRPLTQVWGVRGIVALINFLMWYGSTTILIMVAIMGIDTSLFESAEIDGANSRQSFWKITIPSIRPVLVYVMITSLIGGIQMFDVPQLLTNGQGTPNESAMTLVMYINNNLFSKNYGKAGAISILMFVVSAALSMVVFFMLRDKSSSKPARQGKRRANR